MSFFNADTLISGNDGLVLKDLGISANTPSDGFGSIYLNNNTLYFRSNTGTDNALNLSLSGNTLNSLVSVSGDNSLVSQSSMLFDSTTSNLTIKSTTSSEPKGGTLHFNLEKSELNITDVIGSIEFNNNNSIVTTTYSNIHATSSNLEVKVNNNTPLIIGNTYSLLGGMGFNTNNDYYSTITGLTSPTSSNPQSITYKPFIVFAPTSYPLSSTTYYINVSTPISTDYPTILRILVKKNSADEYLTVSWSGSSFHPTSNLASLNDFSISEGRYAEFLYFPDSSKYYVNKASTI